VTVFGLADYVFQAPGCEKPPYFHYFPPSPASPHTSASMPGSPALTVSQAVDYIEGNVNEIGSGNVNRSLNVIGSVNVIDRLNIAGSLDMIGSGSVDFNGSVDLTLTGSPGLDSCL
jgi:hypothetical protein